MEKKGTILMQKYELGRFLGQGSFAKVYHARHIESGKSVAIKVVDKEKVLRIGLINQIKREISVMRLVRHPNIVELYEVMASKSKIYFAMEFVKGGELFKKVAKGRLREDQAKKYFQQLISAIEYCHSRGVYHRDLKPENLLLDENGNLKITDFGLSALKDSRGQDGLLHTTCGTPAYVAPEVITKRGYDGAKADIWSCGVVLYVLLAGFLPFHDTNLMELYRKICKGEFKCPTWFPSEVRKLLHRILDPCPYSRITMKKLMESPWLRKGFRLQLQVQKPNLTTNNPFLLQDGFGPPITPIDVREAFSLDDEGDGPTDVKGDEEKGSGQGPGHGHGHGQTLGQGSITPTSMNAFDIISNLSQGFDLSGLFENEARKKPEAKFTTSKPPSIIMSKFEEIAQMERFRIQKGPGTVKLQSNKEGRKGMLGINAEIFEVAPTLHMVEVKKTAGDTIEYNDFYNQDLKPALRDIVWTWQGLGGGGGSPFSSTPQRQEQAV